MANADEKPKSEAKPKCFIIMPITVPNHLLETYGKDKDHFDKVLEHLFEPAVKLAGFEPIPPSSDGSKVIHRDIAEKLQNAAMVLCDMSALNPNVFFELGIRTAMDKPVCLVRDTVLPKLPFDTGLIQCHPYDSNPSWGLHVQRKELATHLTATTKTKEYNAGKNAWWQVMGIDFTAALSESSGKPIDRLEYRLASLSEDVRRVVAALSYSGSAIPDSAIDSSIHNRNKLFLDWLRSELNPVWLRNLNWLDNNTFLMNTTASMRLQRFVELREQAMDLFNIKLVIEQGSISTLPKDDGDGPKLPPGKVEPAGE